MRHGFIAIVLALCLVGAPVTTAVIGDAAVATVHAQPELEIQIGEEPWYEQPVWIAIAIIGVVLVILVVVMATRGRGSRV